MAFDAWKQLLDGDHLHRCIVYIRVRNCKLQWSGLGDDFEDDELFVEELERWMGCSHAVAMRHLTEVIYISLFVRI